jgi:hypothetical protein
MPLEPSEVPAVIGFRASGCVLIEGAGPMGILRLSYALHPNPMKGRMSGIFDALGHSHSANLGEDGDARPNTGRFTTRRA